MNLEKPLIPFIMICGHKLLLEYERLHSICFNCGKYGHKLDQCPESSKTEQSKEKSSDHDAHHSKVVNTQVVPQKEVVISYNNDGYGSWMVVKINHRKKGKGKSNSDSKKPSQEVKLTEPGKEVDLKISNLVKKGNKSKVL